MAFLPCSVSNGDFGTGFLTARHVLEATEPRNRERGERKEVDWEEEYTRGLVRLFLKKKNLLARLPRVYHLGSNCSWLG